MAKHLVVARFFHVQDLAFERQDGLIFAVAAHFRGAAGRFALDHEQFAARGVALLAIRKFSGQAARVHRGFTPRKLAGLAGGFAGARGFNALPDDAASHGGVLVEPIAQALVHELLHVALDIAI